MFQSMLSLCFFHLMFNFMFSAMFVRILLILKFVHYGRGNSPISGPFSRFCHFSPDILKKFFFLPSWGLSSGDAVNIGPVQPFETFCDEGLYK